MCMFMSELEIPFMSRLISSPSKERFHHKQRLEYIIFPQLKRLEESCVVLEHRSWAFQWFQNVSLTTCPAFGVI